MSNPGNFRDLLDLLDRVPESPPAPRRRARQPTSPPELRDVAEQRWIVSGILRLAFSADEEER